MIFGIGQFALSLHITTVAVPVAMYFLILGLLNSRPHPQLLRGRRDFALLIVALCPLLLQPVIARAEGFWPVLAVIAAVGGVALLAPPKGSWVIYNILPREAGDAVADALRQVGLPARREGGVFLLTDTDGSVRLSGFPLLRNVSVRAIGLAPDVAGRFEAALSRRLRTVTAETTAATMALLLVATAMLVVPLALVAPRAGQIVRLLTGMLY